MTVLGNTGPYLQDEKHRHEKEDEEKEEVCWLRVVRGLQTNALDVGRCQGRHRPLLKGNDRNLQRTQS